jgi:hypothetical protein
VPADAWESAWPAAYDHAATDLPTQKLVPLTAFPKLLLVRTFHPHCVRGALRWFIEETLGHEAVAPPSLNLPKSLRAAEPIAPLISRIIPGIDSQDEIVAAAATLFVDRYLHPFSLGCGRRRQRGPAAEELIIDAADGGLWVLLQNYHLALSWMPRLDQIVMALHPQKTRPGFRLCRLSDRDPGPGTDTHL